MSETPERLPGWSHMPDVPLKVSPFFEFPLRPMAMLGWLWHSWFLITERLILVALAFATWVWLQPAVPAEFSFGWMIQIWLRNLAIMTVVAGGLHLYFYRWRGQGDRLKFDPRPLMANGKQFTLGGQIRDNMFWTLASGVTVWSLLEISLFWLQARGIAPVMQWSDSPVWFIAVFLLVPIWESFWFYWIHRLLHWPPLYRSVHSLHHRNINVGPWSGLSMHPVEHVLFLGGVVIFLVVPAHPVHVIFLLQYFCLTAATTHSGFEGVVMGDKNRLKLGTFHHQMHHRYFECNYGGLEVPWDKLFGSFHDGTLEANERMKDRRKRIMG